MSVVRGNRVTCFQIVTSNAMSTASSSMQKDIVINHSPHIKPKVGSLLDSIILFAN